MTFRIRMTPDLVFPDLSLRPEGAEGVPTPNSCKVLFGCLELVLVNRFSMSDGYFFVLSDFSFFFLQRLKGFYYLKVD